ncbi:MAG: hypothetical protein IPK21_01300 [Haliscomenobacter sp.]|nr:hypothetical protein [Haliscomenobacter sp.]
MANGESGTACFGIRHHGPGSALALKRALREYGPDLLMVEAPQEAEALFPQLLHPKLELPVALLMYAVPDARKAAYLPFAEFSPELQAIRYGMQAGIPVRAMDLPLAVQFGQESDWSEARGESGTDAVSKDPLQMLAQLAGYDDSERWWDATFEQMDNPASIFALVLEMMQALRQAHAGAESRETLVREAWMRLGIRQAQEEGFERIAVVCGAWHAPVLEDVRAFSPKSDRATIRGLKKEKTKALWIPWSYDRLAFQSGYGAGVISPAWYELLFQRRDALAAHWMVRAARLLRQEQLETSPAQVQEAVRLAETLAALRQKNVPGLGELEDACTGVLCHGQTPPLALIRERLVVGVKMGKVPAGLGASPLQQDLERSVKSARLTREYGSSEKLTKVLDLRMAANWRASCLLHRLRLLGAPWGEPGSVRGESLGSFKEVWKLKWKTDFLIRLIQAGIWGITIQEAARNKALDQIEKTVSLPEALELLDEILKSDLPEIVPEMIRKIQGFAASTSDMDLLLGAFPVLARILRYGSVRKTNLDALVSLVAEVLPRICLGLPDAARNMDEETAKEWVHLILGAHQAVHLLTELPGRTDWTEALARLALDAESHPLLAGLATRLLVEEGVWTAGSAATVLSRALSGGERQALPSALWLEGFTQGSALLLLHTPSLWRIVAQWVDDIPGEAFGPVLPVLRRAFSRFSEAERNMIWQRVREGEGASSWTKMRSGLEEARLQPVTLALHRLLGNDAARFEQTYSSSESTSEAGPSNQKLLTPKP